MEHFSLSSLLVLLLCSFPNNSITMVNACTQYDIDGTPWSDSNLCNSSDVYSISTSTIIAVLEYHWVSILLCTMLLFLASIITLYYYNLRRSAPPSQVTPINVITIAPLSHSENFNEPITFIDLSTPPPYTCSVSSLPE